MSRLFILFITIALFSCRGPSDNKTQQATDTVHVNSKMTQTAVSCEQLLSNLVRSSNAVTFTHFNDTVIQTRIAYLTPEKATIKLYVIHDISETPSEKRVTEHAVGWLELYRKTGKLLDITNDPDNPQVLQYDTTLLQKNDWYKLCTTGAAIANPGTGTVSNDVMLADDIRFNGKLKRFFTRHDFEKVFGKPDSIKRLSEEAPCVTIFDTEAPDDTYWYKNGSRFETSNDSVAVDEFWFRNGNFITYKGIRIDTHTTMKAIEQLFPTAVKGRLGMDKEGKLWVIQLKEDEKGISDGHIKLFFKDGKVYFMHWWFPC